VSSLAALAGSSLAQSRFPEFDAYFQAYTKGRIVYLEPAGGGRGNLILDTLGPGGRLAEAIEELVAAGSRAAAENLLKLASLELEPDPIRERQRQAARQPWAVRAKAGEALRRIRRDEVLDFLSKEVLLARSAYPAAARAAAARALGASGREEFLLPLRAALRDPDTEVRISASIALGDLGGRGAARGLLQALADPDPSVRARAVEAIGRALAAGSNGGNGGAGAFLDAVASRLHDEDWRVRAAAADYFLAHPAAEAIDPLIEAMSSEAERRNEGTGRKRVVFALSRALARLAGSYVSLDDPARWRAWWKAHRESFQAAPALTQSPGASGGEPTYFGIPLRSDRVVFVLDVSGSMTEPMEDRDEPDRPLRKLGAVPTQGPTKIERARAELLATLENLEPEDRFNVIFFHGTCERLFDRLVSATAENRAIAGARIKTIRPAGGTNLFTGLESALEFRDATVEGFGTEADTIFLLSDGEPTAGAIVDPETIATSIAAANRGGRVAIHGIYLGSPDSPGAAFMARLAAENDGVFVPVRP
jgi:hypothetical protein